MNEWEWQLLEDKTPIESVEIQGVQLRRGDRVRLRPRAGGDVFDLALAGKTAAVESLEQDYEGNLHVCVVVEDDPGRDIGLMRQPGHRFFFAPSEVEPIGRDEATPAVETKRILIAGIGNIFLADDGFGVEVGESAGEQVVSVRRPRGRLRNSRIRPRLCVDGGLRDHNPRGRLPRRRRAGTLFVVEPDLQELNSAEAQAGTIEPHGMNPLEVLRMATNMGGPVEASAAGWLRAGDARSGRRTNGAE